MAKKTIFGMSTLIISAGHQYSSHSGTTVVDISGASSNIESFKTPFDKVCFRCSHMNNDKAALFSINQTFN